MDFKYQNNSQQYITSNVNKVPSELDYKPPLKNVKFWKQIIVDLNIT